MTALGVEFEVEECEVCQGPATRMCENCYTLLCDGCFVPNATRSRRSHVIDVVGWTLTLTTARIAGGSSATTVSLSKRIFVWTALLK
jgi:hypothetical protein